MKIAQVSKADAFGGGASRVASDLNDLLNSRHDTSSIHYVSWAGSGYSETRQPLYGSHEKWVRRFHQVGRLAGFPEIVPFELIPELKSKRIQKTDLAHFHDLASAISPLTLSFLSRKMPVLWTIHDASPFTGGCLYPMGCARFKSKCGSCPQLGEWPIDVSLDTTRLSLSVKRHVHEKTSVTAITPSKWMSELAFSSGIFTEKPLVVPNGVNVETFKIRDKLATRRELKLPPKRTIGILSAGNVLDDRKGTRDALEAVRKLSTEIRPYLVLLGNSSPELEELLRGIDFHSAGYVSDQDMIAKYYSAADFFLFCSKAENHPLAVLESMATGTPVVGYSTGGVPEIVDSNSNGLLVPTGDIDALSNALRQILGSGILENWSKNASKKAIRKFSHKAFFENHLDLYNEIIEKWNYEQKNQIV